MNESTEPGNTTHRRVSSPTGSSADNPHGITHSIRPRKERPRLSKAIYFGMLQYILVTEPDNLSDLQQLWISRMSNRLSDEEILKAGRFLEKLLSNADIRFFHVKDILRVRSSIPWIEVKPIPEKVRIGKGYTDKGSLRPYHKRGRQLGEIVFWDSEIQFMLPFDYQVKGEWITADEVKSLLGETLFELVLNQLRQGISHSVDFLQCRYI